jgi:short-subunit dehydrogenase
VPTEFQGRAGVPENSAPALLERSPARVARDGYAALMAGRLYVVPGWPNWLVTLLPRIFPRRILLRIMTIAIDRHVRYEAAAPPPSKPVPNT